MKVYKEFERWLFIKCSVFNKDKTRNTKEQGKIAHSKEQIKSLETVPEETCISDLLDRDFKTTVLNTEGAKKIIHTLRKENY